MNAPQYTFLILPSWETTTGWVWSAPNQISYIPLLVAEKIGISDKIRFYGKFHDNGVKRGWMDTEREYFSLVFFDEHKREIASYSYLTGYFNVQKMPRVWGECYLRNNIEWRDAPPGY